jgi:hypothetical protein
VSTSPSAAPAARAGRAGRSPSPPLAPRARVSVARDNGMSSAVTKLSVCFSHIRPRKIRLLPISSSSGYARAVADLTAKPTSGRAAQFNNEGTRVHSEQTEAVVYDLKGEPVPFVRGTAPVQDGQSCAPSPPPFSSMKSMPAASRAD